MDSIGSIQERTSGILQGKKQPEGRKRERQGGEERLEMKKRRVTEVERRAVKE